MGDSAYPKKMHAEGPLAQGATAGKPDRTRLRAAPRSNLIDVLIAARLAEHRSINNLAEMADVTPDAITMMEAGEGPVVTLLAVLEALPLQVNGLAEGRTFAEQLKNRRAKKGMSLDEIASKTALPRAEILQLESGGGSVEGLLRLLAVVAPRLSRRKQERAYWGSAAKLDRDSRFTPHSFMEAVYDVFGEVDIDPCAHPESPVIARRRFFLSRGDDGLTDPWMGRLAYMNPPYSCQLKWLQRAYDQWDAGNVETILCLVPARTDSAFFQDVIRAKADVFFLRGRLPFGNPAGKSQVTPFSLMVVAFGATAQQKKSFEAAVQGFWVHAGDDRALAFLDEVATCSRKPPRRSREQPVRIRRYDVPSSQSGPWTLRVVCGPGHGI